VYSLYFIFLMKVFFFKLHLLQSLSYRKLACLSSCMFCSFILYALSILLFFPSVLVLFLQPSVFAVLLQCSLLFLLASLLFFLQA